MSKTRASNYGRRKNNPFSTSTFKLEGLSQFDWSHTVAYDTDFGDLRPIACFDNIIGQRTRCNLAYVLNMDPLRKPLYSGINITYDAVYVSDNLLGYDSQKWFNPVTTDEERAAAKQPFGKASSLLYAYYALCNNYVNTENAVRVSVPRPIYNTLYDAFGYPFSSIYYDNLDKFEINLASTVPGQFVQIASLLDPTSDFYESRRAGDDAIILASSSVATADIQFYLLNIFDGSQYSSYDISLSPLYFKGSGSEGAIIQLFASTGLKTNSSRDVALTTYVKSTVEGSISVFSFYSWIFKVCSVDFSGSSALGSGVMPDSGDTIDSWLASHRGYLSSWIDPTTAKLADIDFDRLCRALGWSSYQECLDAYRSYLYSALCYFVGSEICDLRPIFAYRRAYNDLYVNTNLWDCDEFSESVIDIYYSFDTAQDFLGMPSNGQSVYYEPDDRNMPFGFWDIGFLKRWWSNDMFTSAVPADMSAAANAVEIPSSGVTLVDLRNLNIMQEVQERENYAGQRVTDTTFAFFGFKSPELNYYYARHIARITDTPVIQNVLQNSETAETPQANPAGYGTGSKSARFFDFQNPWYGFILVLSSVMTEPVYKDAVPRMILKKDYEDFLFPPYQEISDISVDKSEVQAGESGVLGFQRSYYYYMRQNHRLSGTMRLRQKEEWNTARDFRDGFALNVDFATPNSSDRLNRIFADQSDGINHFNFFVGLDVQTILPLKRDIHYHL